MVTAPDRVLRTVCYDVTASLKPNAIDKPIYSHT